MNGSARHSPCGSSSLFPHFSPARMCLIANNVLIRRRTRRRAGSCVTHTHTDSRFSSQAPPLAPAGRSGRRQDARAVDGTLGPSAFGGSSRRRPAFGGEETCWGPPSSRAGADRPRCWSVASSNYQWWVLFWSISYTVSTPEKITSTCNWSGRRGKTRSSCRAPPMPR